MTDRACTSLEKKSSLNTREENFHKYSLLGLGGGLFLSLLSSLLCSSPGSEGSICVLSVGSVGLIGCEASGARGAAPLFRDLLLRLRRMSGPRAELDVEPITTADEVSVAVIDVEVDVRFSRSRSSRLASRERSPVDW
jgi:hypothetical protein